MVAGFHISLESPSTTSVALVVQQLVLPKGPWLEDRRIEADWPAHGLLFRQQRIFLNVIRFLANDLKVPMICAGTDLARQALLPDQQLAERFDALHLNRWSNDKNLAQLLSSLAGILPLREPSDIGTAAVRQRVLELTDGVTVRIFRMIETAAVEAIRSGSERIAIESFTGGELVLPLISMTRYSERQLQRWIAR